MKPTKEIADKARSMYAEGEDVAVIADELGIPVMRVYMHTAALRSDRAQKLHDAGLSNRAIAKELRVSAPSVSKILSKRRQDALGGVADKAPSDFVRHMRMCQSLEDKVMRMHGHGCKVRSIGRHFNLTDAAVRRIVAPAIEPSGPTPTPWRSHAVTLLCVLLWGIAFYILEGRLSVLEAALLNN